VSRASALILLTLALLGGAACEGAKPDPATLVARLPALSTAGMEPAVAKLLEARRAAAVAAPHDAARWAALGMALDAHQLLVEAESALTVASELEPTRFEHVYLHAFVGALVGTPLDAVIARYNRAIALALALLGQIEVELGRPEQGLEKLEWAARSLPLDLASRHARVCPPSASSGAGARPLALTSTQPRWRQRPESIDFSPASRSPRLGASMKRFWSSKRAKRLPRSTRSSSRCARVWRGSGHLSNGASRLRDGGLQLLGAAPVGWASGGVNLAHRACSRLQESPMKFSHSLSTCALGAFLVSAAQAQVGVETFANGNPEGWEIWFSPYNYLRATGGNPGEYLELDNVTSGPLTCQFLNIKPDRTSAGVLTHSGNWRAAGVDQVSVDVKLAQGPLNGTLTLVLISDPGTPLIATDDCILRLSQPAPAPTGTGWTTLTFPCDTSSTTIPAGWTLDTASMGCPGATLDQVWNTLVQDMDEVRFRYDTNPGFCTFTAWRFGIDNVTIGQPGSGGPGTPYCTPANVNTSGAAATLRSTGSSVVTANNLALVASDMPQQQFGFFLTSRTQGNAPNPGGSNGVLCLGGTIGRYVAPGQIMNAGLGGTFSLALDLGMTPAGAAFVAIQAGEAWNFQAWFRDVGPQGQPQSNFTDALEVMFQ